METNKDSNNSPHPNELPDYTSSLGMPSKYGLLLSRIVETEKNEYLRVGTNIKSPSELYKREFYYYALQSILKSKSKPDGEFNYDDELKQVLIAINNNTFEKYLLDNHSKLYEKAFYIEIFRFLIAERTRNLDKREFHPDKDVDGALKSIRDGDLDNYIRLSGTSFDTNFFKPTT